jgi:hypothetical protein
MSRQDALTLRTLIGSAWLTQAIYVAAKIGVADHLDKPASVKELAIKSNTKPELLHRVLRGLASRGIFKELEPGTFDHTDLSRQLISNAPNSLRNVALFYGDQSYLAFKEFENQLRTGEIAYEKVYGTDLFSNIKNDSERSEIFNRAMREISYEQAGAIIDSFDFSTIETLCDVGGGKGHLLAAILHANPKMKGILLDQEHVMHEAKALMEQEKIAVRVRCEGGSFFDPIKFKADACILKYIVHDWSDEHAINILKNCRQSFNRILVVEQMIPPGNEPLYGKLSDLMMMTVFGAKERTEDEFKKIFQAAGLKLNKIHATDYLLYIFELSH